MTITGVAAADLNWTGAVGNRWSDARNWSPAQMPSYGDRLFFNSGGHHLVNDIAGLSVGYIYCPRCWIEGEAIGISGLLHADVVTAPLVAVANDAIIAASSIGDLDVGTYTVDARVSEVTGLLRGSGVAKFAQVVIGGTQALFTGTIRAYTVAADGLTLTHGSIDTLRITGDGILGPVTASEVAPRPRLRIASLVAPAAYQGTVLDVVAPGSVLELSGPAMVPRWSLRLQFTPEHTPRVGERFTLVALPNAETAATFESWRGTRFHGNGVLGSIRLDGGDGNDVEFVVDDLSSIWKGGQSIYWSNPANWLFNLVPAAGMNVSITTDRDGPTSLTNDIPGLRLESVVVDGSIRDLDGYGITLASDRAVVFMAPLASVNLPLTLEAPAAIVARRMSAVLDVGSHDASLELDESLSAGLKGTGTVRFAGSRLDGSMEFAGTLELLVPMSANVQMPKATVSAIGLNANGVLGALKNHGALRIYISLEVGHLELGPASSLDNIDRPFVATRTVKVGGTIGPEAYFPTHLKCGESFTVIRNDGAGPVLGEFAGMPEGTVVVRDGQRFRLSYRGGDGNDVTFQVLSDGLYENDFDADCRSDIMWHNVSTGELFRMSVTDGPGAWGEMVYREPDTAWQVVGNADFDSDGTHDLLWRHALDGRVYVMPFELGKPRPGRVVYREPDASWIIVGTPDLDADGRADILWWHSVTGRLHATLLDAQGVKMQADIYREPDTRWQVAGVGDLGNGRENAVVWRHSQSGQVYVMYVWHSAGGFTVDGGHVHVEPDPAWKIVGVRSGAIYWLNRALGYMSAQRFNGFAPAGNSLYSVPSSEWAFEGFGRFRIGQLDYARLWRHQSTGEVAVDMLNGAPSRLVVVYREPNTQWQITSGSPHAR